MEGNSADRSRRKSLPKGTGTAPHISLSERALTDAVAATGLDTKNAVDRVKASMPSREKLNLSVPRSGAEDRAIQSLYFF